VVFDPNGNWIELSQRTLIVVPLRERDRIALDTGFGRPVLMCFCQHNAEQLSHSPSDPLVETTTIAGWGLARQSVKCSGECTRLAKADI
jgi:hypothetical protein